MPDDIVEREVLGEASRACGVLVERVRGRVARKGGATAGELSHYAAAAFEAYAETLLRALMAAASRREGGDVEALGATSVSRRVGQRGHAAPRGRGRLSPPPYRGAGAPAEDVRGRADASTSPQSSFLRRAARRHSDGRRVRRRDAPAPEEGRGIDPANLGFRQRAPPTAGIRRRRVPPVDASRSPQRYTQPLRQLPKRLRRLPQLFVLDAKLYQLVLVAS